MSKETSVPLKKHFKTTSWDEIDRKFTGEIDWQDQNGFLGDETWQVQIKLSDNLSKPSSGLIACYNELGLVTDFPTYTYPKMNIERLLSGSDVTDEE